MSFVAGFMVVMYTLVLLLVCVCGQLSVCSIVYCLHCYSELCVVG